MTENTPEFFEDPDQPDLEVPEDGRDGQPPEEGSSDEPETLAIEDPLGDEQVVLSDTDGLTTVSGQVAEPLADDDWSLEEEQIIDPDELEEEYPDDSQ